MVSPGARLARVEHVGRVEGDSIKPIATRPLVWNFSTFQPFNFSTSYYTHDGNKNVSDLVASSNLSVAAHYEYAPFGDVVESDSNESTCAQGQSSCNPFGFSSEYSDSTLDLVYYNYRHYEPMCGRWMSRDIIGVYGGVNESIYCINDPTIHGDILGLERNAPPNSIDTGIRALPIVDKCKVIFVDSKFQPYDKYFEVERNTPIRLDFAVKNKSESNWDYSNIQLRPDAPPGIKLFTLSYWDGVEEKRNKGIKSGQKARRKYICSIKFVACCERKLDGSVYIYAGERKSLHYVNGHAWMAIDNELGRWWSSTPDKHRYENASFAENPREYNSLEVDCESRAKKLKTIENVRTEYTKREMWSLLRKDK